MRGSGSLLPGRWREKFWVIVREVWPHTWQMLPPLAGMADLFGSRRIVGSVGVMFIG